MKAKQIEEYEYCKSYAKKLSDWKSKIPFGQQEFGLGSQAPNIEVDLQEIQTELYKTVISALVDAEKKVAKRIEEI